MRKNMPKCGIFHRGTAVSAVQCSAQIMKQNNHDNSRYCVNSMKNLPANESGCADHHGGGCGCGCVPSGGRASSCGAGRGATPATWTGRGGGRHDLRG